MKKKVTLKRFFHRGEERIGIFFGYDEGLKDCVKQIPGVVFSSTNKCFYTSDTEENLKNIIRVLKEVTEIDISGLTSGKHILQHSEPDRTDKPVKKEPDHLIEKEESAPQRLLSGFVEFRISEEGGSLVIRLPIPFEKRWVSELRSYRGRYDSSRREWYFTWSKMTCDSLADYFSKEGVQVILKKEKVNSDLRTERKKVLQEINKRSVGPQVSDSLVQMADYLDEKRYSPRTKEAYLSMMEYFFRYFENMQPDEISGEDISEFIQTIVIKLGYSAAYQNQMISAIKTYYQVNGPGRINIDILSRPRKRRSLPKTFSKEEVGRILNAPGNVKHKLLLWIVYSCGLRRSEVINIRLKDIDRSRSIIHILEGKGKVDRIVPVPAKVFQKIDEYLASYSPVEYLFEGQSGGRYASESVYRVFKQALHRAGIKKDVGIHCLRHSYATHLHENGLDIKYIQELLGHKSTRTTEIYTHVSRRNLVAVRSPIEDLDVK